MEKMGLFGQALRTCSVQELSIHNFTHPSCSLTRRQKRNLRGVISAAENKTSHRCLSTPAGYFHSIGSDKAVSIFKWYGTIAFRNRWCWVWGNQRPRRKPPVRPTAQRFRKNAEAVSLISASFSGGSDCQSLCGAWVQLFDASVTKTASSFN
jgi:hypothetical protein